MPICLTGDSRASTPHNFAADLYPYLILTARLTHPSPLRGTHAGDAAERGAVYDSGPRRCRAIWTCAPVRWANGACSACRWIMRRMGVSPATELPRPHAVVLSHGRPDRLRDGACSWTSHAPQAAGRRQRAERGLPAGAGAPLHDAGDARYLAWARRIGDAYAWTRCCRATSACRRRSGTSRRTGRAAAAPARSRQRTDRRLCLGPSPSSPICNSDRARALRARRPPHARSRLSLRPMRTACSTTRSTRRRWRPAPIGACRTTGATSTARSTRSIRSPAR